jgi:hypothetical protein
MVMEKLKKSPMKKNDSLTSQRENLAKKERFSTRRDTTNNFHSPFWCVRWHGT